MSLVSTFAAALPQPLREPSPRSSDAARRFDALMHELDEVQPPAVEPPHGDAIAVMRVPPDGPSRAVWRRRRH